MKKFTSREMKLASVLLLGSVVTAPPTMVAQDHVVPPAQIQKDVANASATRQLHEQQLKSFLSRKEIQNAMKSEGVNPKQVNNAVSQLSDAELTRLAARTQKAQRDFAGGLIGMGIFTLIGVVVVAVILVAVFA